MGDHTGRCLAIFALLLVSHLCLGQRIVSESPPDVNRYFLPYDLSYNITLEDKHFIQLREYKSNIMKLCRYNAELDNIWQKEISFDMGESVPEIFLKGDTVVLYSHNTVMEKGKFILSFRYFDQATGQELPGNIYPVTYYESSGIWPDISISEDRSKIVIYNFLSEDHNENKACFQVFDIGVEKMKLQYFLDKEVLHASKTSSIHLSNFGDIFYVCSNVEENKVESYYWSARKQEVKHLSNQYFFNDQIDEIGEFNILKQSVSSYLVSFTAKSEEGLEGFNISSYNVILKSVMFSHNQNLDQAMIESALDNKYVFNSDEISTMAQANLKNYQLVNTVVNKEKDVILMFEDLDLADANWKVDNNMVWNPKFKKDKKYQAGDLLMFCYSAAGEQLWSSAVQKTQWSKGSHASLSFVSNLENENLRLLMQESSGDGGIYLLELDIADGSIDRVVDILPGKKVNLYKKYSCWLDDNSAIIGTTSSSNSNKKSLMLVEF